MNDPSLRPVVLVVDDEPILRMHAALIVEDIGLQAIEASNADEAIAILQSRPDIRVVLTDAEIPGSMNGLKLIEMIRRRWPPIALIVLSGHLKIDERALPAGARFVARPFAEREFLRVVAEMAG